MMNQEEYEQAVSFWERKDRDAKHMEPEALREWIDHFLSERRVLVLATGTGDFQRATPLEYTWHDDALWIFTEGGLKFRGLRANPQVAAAVFDPTPDFGRLQSVQIEGVAEIISLFSPAYLAEAARRQIPEATLRNLPEPMWLLKIVPSEITCLNSGFRKDGCGSRQTWRSDAARLQEVPPAAAQPPASASPKKNGASALPVSLPLDARRTAFLVIDMQKAFVEPGAALEIAGAKATIPAITSALHAARSAAAQVWWVEREYAADGADMEKPRRQALAARGLAGVLAPGSTGLNSVEQPEGLSKEPGDHSIIKKRYSAFFGTDLDTRLREAGIQTIVLLGTTTPNCIRSTCYDGISLNYDVVVLEPCCSSATPEIQTANIADMERAGALIWRSADLTGLL